MSSFNEHEQSTNTSLLWPPRVSTSRDRWLVPLTFRHATLPVPARDWRRNWNWNSGAGGSLTLFRVLRHRTRPAGTGSGRWEDLSFHHDGHLLSRKASWPERADELKTNWKTHLLRGERSLDLSERSLILFSSSSDVTKMDHFGVFTFRLSRHPGCNPTNDTRDDDTVSGLSPQRTEVNYFLIAYGSVCKSPRYPGFKSYRGYSEGTISCPLHNQKGSVLSLSVYTFVVCDINRESTGSRCTWIQWGSVIGQ